MDLSAEMCYPIEVLMGHYRELVNQNPDFIFIPEVIDLEPLPWAEGWPRSLSCPLLMMIRGVAVHSLNIAEDKVLHAQLNYREGPARIREQMMPLAKKLLGKNFSHAAYRRAIEEAYHAQKQFQLAIEKQGRRIVEGLAAYPDTVVALILGRSYTLYDPFVSKDLMAHAAQRGLIALSQDFLLEYLRGWYEGRIKSAFLDPHRADFERYMKEKIEHMDNIYPAQLQHILSAALAAQFFNKRAKESGLPRLHLVLQDPFRCGPNSMLRHYLDNVCGYLRLTLDEHTAPAGMITRLEAFKNTCRSRKSSVVTPFFTAKTAISSDPGIKKILIPNSSKHPEVFVAMFENYGIEAALLPRGSDKDLTLARRCTNGEECLPFIQNMQDYLEYAENNPREFVEEGTVLFQGWACGPCRYGLYATTQSMLINRAGYGERKICSFKSEDIIKKFGPEFLVAIFDGTVTVDLLYKMLHSTRPYERVKGAAETLFDQYCEQALNIIRRSKVKWPEILSGKHLAPLEALLSEAADRFAAITRINGAERRPRIMVAGEFYVRIDDRCNKNIIDEIEKAGGEVSLAPASEFFIYTAFANYRKAAAQYAFKKSIPNYLNKIGYSAISRLAHRDEHRLEKAAANLLHGQEEPSPLEIRKHAAKYIPENTAGEPPMTVGRTGALAGREAIAGAIFVGPFTCMPASVVEAQQGSLSKEIGLPIISVYYDGRENSNRDEFIHSLVFQAKQNLKLLLQAQQ